MIIRKREQGKLFYVPFLFNYILIPLLFFLTYRKYGMGDQARNIIVSFSQYFTSILVCWWIFPALIKYIDTEGNEIFYIQKRMKWKEVFNFFLFYVFSNTMPFIIYCWFFHDMWLEWIRIFIEIMLFASMSYCLAFVFNHIAFAIAAVMTYAFSSVFFTELKTSIWIYYGMNTMTLESLKSKYLILFGSAIVLFFIGIVVNGKKESYK